MKKKAHIIGIAGKNTAPLAKLFKEDLGWKVSGSDQEKIYDPARSYLKRLAIPVSLGFKKENIRPDLNLIVVGGAAFKQGKPNPEYEKAKKLGLEILSHSQAMKKYFLKENSVCIAGTFGKTTITALMVFIFKAAEKDFSYFIGEKTIGLKDYLEVGNSNWSVAEADESAYREMEFDSGPRFLNYRPKYVLITSAEWEHKDVYSSKEKYFKAFADFVGLIPSKGLLVINKRVKNGVKLISLASCPIVAYSGLGGERGDWFIAKIEKKGEKTKLIIKGPKEKIELLTILPGKYNWENIAGAVALARNLGIEAKAIKKGVFDFRGVKRRLELLGKPGGVYFYDDFAQSAVRVRASLDALVEKHPKTKITVIFDPHATALGQKGMLTGYESAFSSADSVFISKVTFYRKISGQSRVSGADWVKAVQGGGAWAGYFPLAEDLVGQFLKKAKAGEVCVFMSSGGLRGEKIKKEIIAKLKKGGK